MDSAQNDCMLKAVGARDFLLCHLIYIFRCHICTSCTNFTSNKNKYNCSFVSSEYSRVGGDVALYGSYSFCPKKHNVYLLIT